MFPPVLHIKVVVIVLCDPSNAYSGSGQPGELEDAWWIRYPKIFIEYSVSEGQLLLF